MDSISSNNPMNPISHFFLFLIVGASFSNAFRILFILPCYGGHFATMSPVIATLSFTNEVTVIATSPLCDSKITSLQKIAKFELIHKDIGWGDTQLDGLMDVAKMALWKTTERFTTQLDFLREFLTQNKSRFDVMVVDFTMEGALLAGEITNMPTVSLFNALTGAAEHVIEKMEFPISDIIISRLVFGYHLNYVMKTRSSYGMPQLVMQQNLYGAEYQARFPSMVAGSPLFYPEVHPSVHHTFVGGIRNESHFDELDSELEKWLDLGETNVVYISLGTVFKISEAKLAEWVKELRSQDEFRFIWYMNRDMQTLANNLELKSDNKLLISGYLPQFTLLGHKKVKVFVTHGGFGSVTDAIKRGKPFVCSPQLFDQPYNCRKMKQLGASETSQFNFVEIMEAIRKIIDGYESYVSKANIIAANYESYEKRETLEKFLSEVAAKRRADVITDFGFDLCSARSERAWMITKVSLITISLLLIFLIFKISSFVIRVCAKKIYYQKLKQL